MPPNPTASIAIAIDQVVALEQTINASLPDGATELVVYRWRPQGIPDVPALWNWLVESPQDIKDLAHLRDRLDLRIQIAVAHTNVDEEMAAIELYADAFRATVDPALRENCTLDGTVEYAKRISMRTALDRFNQIDLLCVEFALEIQLTRIVT